VRQKERASNHPLEERNTTPEEVQLMEQLVERSNMKKAYAQVMRNKGAAGIDHMPVESLMPYLHESWPEIKEQLLKGQYKPKPVRKVEIPKPGGGRRQLGIPTVLDRLIQQAMHQILSPIFEPTFSENSYGFRPGRSAHDAVKQARKYQTEGRRWVVDMDLAKFFDEVNHDILMSKIAKKVKDKRMLFLIRRYLQAGVMSGGLLSARDKGTPQGGPLSPLLSNIVLDELDRELERRGHSFCRYADDCNVYVKSEKAGQRVFESMTKFVEEKLKLKVNKEKSAVARPHQRKFLGYSFTGHKQPRLRVPKESVKKIRGRLKAIFGSARGRNIQKTITEALNPAIRGWINYFRMAEVKVFAEELDGWIRRRLRLILWKQWKKPWTRRKRLINAGLLEERAVMSAFNRRGPWWNSGASHMNDAFRKKFFDKMGLVSMLDELYKFRTINFGNRPCT
jgi:group II intron reverse transcriptase/maturase